MARLGDRLSAPSPKKRRLAIYPVVVLGLVVGWQAYSVHDDIRQTNWIAQQTGTTLANAHQLATKQERIFAEFGRDQFQAFNVLVERRIDARGLMLQGMSHQGELVSDRPPPAGRLALLYVRC